MRRLLIPMMTALLLTACSGKAITYELNVSENLTKDSESAVVLAALRVIERRLANIGEEVKTLSLDECGNTHCIHLRVGSLEAIDTLSEQLTLPFDLQVMQESSVDGADIVVEGHGGFSQTGLNGDDFEWLEASEEEGGKGRVTIRFTPEGREKMAGIFRQNVGKSIGLFVRRNLISKLLVETDEVKDDIIITDIPTVALANIFADDVNVGLHVTFRPVP